MINVILYASTLNMKMFSTTIIIFISLLSSASASEVYPKNKLPYDVVSGFKDLRYSLWAKPYRDYALTIDKEIVRAGDKSFKFEIRKGDCGWSEGWSDCDNDRGRHELSAGGKDDIMIDGEYWFAWSIYLPEGHENLYPMNTNYGQFHQRAGPPVFMFMEKEDGYSLVKTIEDDDYQEVLLVSNKDFVGKWNDILVNVNWSKKYDGFFKVWVNNKLKYKYRGPTKTKEKVYYKFGIYRSYMNRYKGSEMPTTIAYFDEIRKGKSKETVIKGLIK